VAELPDKIASRIEQDAAGCWIWTGNRAMGYGHFWWEGRMRFAHRYTYELFVGPIPDGLEIDHLCRVRECCNPKHLEAVTHSENLRRSPLMRLNNGNLAKTHCPQGHPYDETNTRSMAKGGRACKACDRERFLRTYVPSPRVPVTHCPSGHEYDEANTHINKKGHRICRACARERMRAKYRKVAS